MNNNETFAELRAYFYDRWDSLPKIVGNKYMIVRNVQFAVKVNIERIENIISLDPSKVKNSPIAKDSKARLIEIKKMVEDENCHLEKEDLIYKE